MLSSGQSYMGFKKVLVKLLAYFDKQQQQQQQIKTRTNSIFSTIIGQWRLFINIQSVSFLGLARSVDILNFFSWGVLGTLPISTFVGPSPGGFCIGNGRPLFISL